MNQEKLNIADMQCWIFRMAQKKWNITSAACAELFIKYDLLGYVSECYDLLHLSSYQVALKDIEDILRSHGETIC